MRLNSFTVAVTNGFGELLVVEFGLVVRQLVIVDGPEVFPVMLAAFVGDAIGVGPCPLIVFVIIAIVGNSLPILEPRVGFAARCVSRRARRRSR